MQHVTINAPACTASIAGDFADYGDDDRSRIALALVADSSWHHERLSWVDLATGEGIGAGGFRTVDEAVAALREQYALSEWDLRVMTLLARRDS